jgi:hypothetical protein
MFVLSKEETLFGAVLIASGSSQLVYSWIFSESSWLVFGLAFVSLGIAITILGFLWTNRNPAGITVLGLSFCLSGFLAIVAGVLLLAPLLASAAVSFALSWGLIRRKAWARPASLLTTALVLSASVVTGMISTRFPAADTFPFVPSTLVSIYLLWYLMRPHVIQLFDPENSVRRRLHRTGEEPNKRGPLAIATVFLLLTSFLVYSYSNPLSGMPVAAEVNIRGSLGAGELGTPASGRELQFWASRGDLLNCSFRCTDAEPVHVWLVRYTNENTSTTLLERISLEGSESALAPQTCNYAMWITTQRPGRADVLCEIWVTSFSLRRPIVQSLLLSLFGAAVSLSLVLKSTRKLPE